MVRRARRRYTPVKGAPEGSRLYGNLYGASRVGVPVTAIAKIERVAMYDGREALANDFKLEGLTPCNHIVVVTLEK